MSEHFDFQKLEKNSIEELQTQYFELDDQLCKLIDIINESQTNRDNIKCVLWNIQEIIRKKRKNLVL